MGLLNLLLLAVSTLAFLVSAGAYGYLSRQDAMFLLHAAGSGPDRLFSVGPSLALTVLQWIVLLALLWNLLRTARNWLAPTPAEEGRVQLERTAPLVLSLIAGAAWPWAEAINALAGVGTAAAMLIGALAALLVGGPGVRGSISLGIYAGWGTAVFAASLARLTIDVGLSARAAQPGAVLVLAGLTAIVQLRLMGPYIGYVLTVFLALIGIAVSTIDSELGIASAAVIALASLSLVLVRVTT